MRKLLREDIIIIQKPTDKIGSSALEKTKQNQPEKQKEKQIYLYYYQYGSI